MSHRVGSDERVLLRREVARTLCPDACESVWRAYHSHYVLPELQRRFRVQDYVEMMTTHVLCSSVPSCADGSSRCVELVLGDAVAHMELPGRRAHIRNTIARVLFYNSYLGGGKRAMWRWNGEAPTTSTVFWCTDDEHGKPWRRIGFKTFRILLRGHRDTLVMSVEETGERAPDYVVTYVLNLGTPSNGPRMSVVNGRKRRFALACRPDILVERGRGETIALPSPCEYCNDVWDCGVFDALYEYYNKDVVPFFDQVRVR